MIKFALRGKGSFIKMLRYAKRGRGSLKCELLHINFSDRAPSP